MKNKLKKYLTHGLTLLQLAAPLSFSGCLKKNPVEPDNPPIIQQYEPQQTGLNKNLNDVVDFEINAQDPDNDEINYKFLKDNEKVSDNNEYKLEINEVGSATILGIAYNDLADTIKWVVNTGSKAPVAIVNDVNATIDSPVNLDGSNSYHPDAPLNEIVGCEWEQISGESVNIENNNNELANFTPLTSGEYKFVLTVIDDLNQEDKDTLTATINSYLINVNAKNVLNDENIEGLEVKLINSGKTAFTVNGDVSFEVPTEGEDSLLIRDEATSDYGDYFDYSRSLSFNGDENLDVEMIPNVPDSIYSDYYPNILNFIKHMTRTDGSLNNTVLEMWRSYPIQTFYNRNEHPNQDYTDALINSLGDVDDPNLEGWENKTGIDLFEEVQQDPTEGIIMDYSSSSTSHVVFEDYPDFTPRRAIICIDNDLPTPSTTYRDNIHEIGHAIFNSSKHSSDPNHVMIGGGGSHGLSDYETEAIKTIILLNNFTEMSYYLED